MGKNKTLLLIISLLLVTNFVMLYFLLKPQPNEPNLSRSERMAKMLQTDLGLDTAQINKYYTLRKYRDEQLRPLQQEMRLAKLSMMNLLNKEGATDAEIDSAALLIGQKQSAIEIAYFKHFKRMQQMLNANQQLKFDTMLRRMIYRSTGGADSAASTAEKR